MSVFESIAVVEGRPLLLESHLERLAQAAKTLDQEGSACQSRDSIRKHIDPALTSRALLGFSWNAVEFQTFDFSELHTGLLRFYLTAGEGPPDAPFAGNAYALFDQAEVGWNLPPLRVESSAAPYLPRPGGWKTGNYWQNIDALAAARRAGCDEALLFNPAGMLVGAAMANVFVHIGGRWITPARETGARDGAVRAWLLESIGAAEEILDAESLREADAVFLSNSRIGVRPVAVMDGRPLRDLSQEIQRRYFDEVYSC